MEITGARIMAGQGAKTGKRKIKDQVLTTAPERQHSNTYPAQTHTVQVKQVQFREQHK